jgi:hypothetical protein
MVRILFFLEKKSGLSSMQLTPSERLRLNFCEDSFRDAKRWWGKKKKTIKEGKSKSKAEGKQT